MTHSIRLAARALVLSWACLALAMPAGGGGVRGGAAGCKGCSARQGREDDQRQSLPGATMPPGYVTSSGANAGWSVSTDSFLDAPNSLKSGAVADGQRADVETTVTTGEGTMTFARRVSSEAGFDFLRFYVDGVEVAVWSGEWAWEVVSVPVTAGSHAFRWSYHKDASDAGGLDAAWIDAVAFPEPFVRSIST